jgi:acetyltransferase-like isoleucine patch superfamily enzyme
MPNEAKFLHRDGRIVIIQQINTGRELRVLQNPYIRLGSGAKIIKSNVLDNLTIDTDSCINKCDIGRYFGLGCFSYVANSQIGRYCTFGARVSIGAFSHPTDWLSIHEFQYRNTANIYGSSILDGDVNIAPVNAKTNIGCDVWIGDNACVMAGTSLAHGAIVSLGAVVMSDVPPYAIVGGNPARILRYRFNEDVISKLLSLKWWELDMEYLKGIDFSDIDKSISCIEEIRRNYKKADDTR